MANNQRHASVKVTNGAELVRAVQAVRAGRQDAVKVAAVIRKYVTAASLPTVAASLLQTYSQDDFLPVIKQAVELLETEAANGSL